jgi:hypothetical protein
MAPKKVVVKGDPVRGTDTHKVSGTATNQTPPPPTVPYTGTARFDYVGSMSEDLSDLLFINEVPVALKTSRSSLDPGEDVTGKHAGPKGSGFVPPTPVPTTNTLSITDTVGPGKPSASAGSAFVTVNGDKILLDGDAMDTCDVANAIGNSKVTSEKQSLVVVAE